MTAARQEGPLGQIHLDLVAKGKANKSALGAIMRRLLLLMRAVLKSGLPIDPEIKARRKLMGKADIPCLLVLAPGTRQVGGPKYLT